LGLSRVLSQTFRAFDRAIAANRAPDKVGINKSRANLAGLHAVDVNLKFIETGAIIKILQVKYLNNTFEQGQRLIKRITAPMLAFLAFHSADATIASTEAVHMIRKGQLGENGLSAFQQFAAFAA